MTRNRKMAQRRKRSVDPDVPTDPAAFLEGGIPGKYKCVSTLEEQHGGHLYCVSVCGLRNDHADLFATVGANCASVYRLEDDGGVTLLRAFADDDPEEQYFACAWCEASTGELLLAVAGRSGVVRVLDASAPGTRAGGKTRAPVFRDLRGHGGSVNDVRAHPCAPHLLLSASKDESCRLWNVDNGVCVFVFSGALGHRNEVLSVDVKPSPLFSKRRASGSVDGNETDADDADARDFVFVSGGMDNTVKVWSTRGYSHLLELSEKWPEQRKKTKDGAIARARVGSSPDDVVSRRRDPFTPRDAVPPRQPATDVETATSGPDTSAPFPTGHVQTPVFSSFKMHGNYADCVRWFGDLVLSKSVEQKVLLWAFDRARREKGEVGVRFRVVREFAAKHADIWFLRFAVDVGAGCVALGNRVGDVFMWNANAAAGLRGGRGGAPAPPTLVAALSDRHCTKAVRQTAFARGGRVVLAACDGGTVWRWDLVENVAARTGAAEKKTDEKKPSSEPLDAARDDLGYDDRTNDEANANANARLASPLFASRLVADVACVSDSSENPSVVDLVSDDENAAGVDAAHDAVVIR